MIFEQLIRDQSQIAFRARITYLRGSVKRPNLREITVILMDHSDSPSSHLEHSRERDQLARNTTIMCGTAAKNVQELEREIDARQNLTVTYCTSATRSSRVQISADAPCCESVQTFLVQESSNKVSQNNENFMKKKQSDQWKRANRGSVTIKPIIRITTRRPELTARPYGFQRQLMRTGQKSTCGAKLP